MSDRTALVDHARNIGKMIGPEDFVSPDFLWMGPWKRWRRTARPEAALQAIPSRGLTLKGPAVAQGAIDISLEVLLQTDRQFAKDMAPSRLTGASFRHRYWTVAHSVTHHSMGSCNLRSGNLPGTATICYKFRSYLFRF